MPIAGAASLFSFPDSASRSRAPARIRHSGWSRFRRSVAATALMLALSASMGARATFAAASVPETAAKRAAAVTILRAQFAKAGGFTSEQLAGFYTWMQLSNEIDNDIKKGIQRTPDYYQKRRLSINDFFRQEILARPTLLSQRDAALVVWKTEMAFSPLTLGAKLASFAGIKETGALSSIADAAKQTIETAASIYEHEFNPTKALSNEELIASFQDKAAQKLRGILYAGWGKCDQAPSACAAMNALVNQMGRPSDLDIALPFNLLADKHLNDAIPPTMRAAGGVLRFEEGAEEQRARVTWRDLIDYGVRPDLAAVRDESQRQLNTAPASSDGAQTNPGTDTVRSAERAAQIELAFKSVDFSAQLIGLVNPRLGSQIETVNHATAATATYVSTYLTALRDFKKGGGSSLLSGLKLASSSIDFASGLVGVGFQVFSMFSSGGPSPDELIMEQIQRLAEQVEAVRVQMHERFDRVDLALNEIMSTLHDNFQQIDYSQRIVLGNVQDVRAELLSVQAHLDRMELDLSRWLQDSQRDDFVQNVNRCIGYNRRFGLAMTQGEFVNCTSFFYTWSTSTSRRDLYSASDKDDFSEVGIADNVARPIPDNVNWLSRFVAKNLGLAPLSPDLLANPLEWALGAQALLQLFEEQPQWASPLIAADLKNVLELGLSLRQTVANGSKRGQARSLPPLFEALLNKYYLALVRFRDEVRGAEHRYLGQPVLRLDGIDIYGGARQNVAHVPQVNYLSQCDAATTRKLGAKSDYGVPPGILDLIPASVRVGEMLGLGSFSLCLAHEVVESRSWTLPPLGRTVESPTLRVAIKGFYKGELVLSRAEDSACLGMCETALALNLFNLLWDKPLGAGYPSHRDRYMSASQNVDTAAVEAAVGRVEKEIDEVLQRDQMTLHATLASELSQAGAVASAARSLDANKRLIISYAALLLARSMRTNETLRGLLAGDQSLIDSSTALHQYQAATGTERPDPILQGEERLASLRSALEDSFAALEVSEMVEGIDVVDDVLADLELFTDVDRLETTTNHVPDSTSDPSAGTSPNDPLLPSPPEVSGDLGVGPGTPSMPGSVTGGIYPAAPTNPAASGPESMPASTDPLSQVGIDGATGQQPTAAPSGACDWSVATLPQWAQQLARLTSRTTTITLHLDRTVGRSSSFFELDGATVSVLANERVCLIAISRELATAAQP